MASAQCCSNPPTLDPAAGAGRVEKVAGVNAYVAGSDHSTVAILFISDVFGYQAPKLRKLADKFGAKGFYTVVPDYFNGDYFSYENADRPVTVWQQDHDPEKAIEISKPIIEALKAEGISSVGAAGNCWGAKPVIQLAKSGLVKVGAMSHPAVVTADDFKGIDVPIAILGAEIDHLSPPEVIKQFEQSLATNSGVDSFVKIYPKVEHGWTTRYKDDDPVAVKAAEEAHEDLLAWFAKHLK